MDRGTSVHEKHILIVEDQAILRTAVREILASEGYRLLTASNGVQALEVMEEIRPDLIIADIAMPQMDGFELYRAIRARPEWVTIPFIFLTARGEREDVLKGKALGAEDYILKPFEAEELLVTIRAKLERARAVQQATKTELDDLKHQIVTVLGHELRTPLTYVTGYTDLALSDVSELGPDEFQQLLLGVKRGADRLTRLTEDFLLLVRLDSGEAAEEFQFMARASSEVDKIVERVVSQYRNQATAQGLALEATVESNLPPVRLFEPFFVDALGRLLDNAIKFSRDRGQRIAVSAQSVDGWVEVTVADEGVGIRAENLPCVFERFRQIDRGRMEQQGVGLGVPIAQELIRLHGGDIAVESVPGQGSTFKLRLPSCGDR